SFESMRVLAMAVVTRAEEGMLARVLKPSNGSQMLREKGSKTLLRRPLPKRLRAIGCWVSVGFLLGVNPKNLNE
ncbi:hypothetical protein, partial [Clostridium perfringens]